MSRQAKIIKKEYDEKSTASLSIFNEEVVINANEKSSVRVGPEGIEINAPPDGALTLNTMSPQYAGGFLRDNPFPFSLLPGIIAPPRQIPNIPFREILPTLSTISAMSRLLVI